MTSTGEHSSDASSEANAELAELLERTALARSTLARLEEDVVCADRRLGSTQSSQLREANEQLVIAVLRARTEADIARSSLAAAQDPTALDARAFAPAGVAPTTADSDDRHAQLREANEQLVLAALNAQSRQAAAQQAHQLQTEFLAVLAHELRNPLVPIRTTAALLARVPAAELPRLQGILERQVNHLARLVNDLFDVSRVRVGKLKLELQDVNMEAIIAEAIDTCRPAMDQRGQAFGSYVTARTLMVRGDAVRLSQVLINLLDNASKYTPVGGAIRLSAVVVEQTLVLTVSDNGIGIPAEELPRVFDPFVQDPRAVRFNGDGLGIGLTVVRELIEAHGGTVSAQSAGSGLGSQFAISLPLSA